MDYVLRPKQLFYMLKMISLDIWKLNNILLVNQWVKEEVNGKITDKLKLNGNKTTIPKFMKCSLSNP